MEAARSLGGAQPRRPAPTDRYRSLVEASREIFFYQHDAERRFTYLSPSVADILGYAPAELLGKPYDSLLGEGRSAEIALKRTQRALTNGHRTGVHRTRVLRRDGRPITLEVVETPLTHPSGTVGLQGFARDVTEIETAELTLQRRLTADGALAEVSGSLAKGGDVDLTQIIGVLGHAVGASRAYVFSLRLGGKRMDNTHEWCAPGVKPQIGSLQDIHADMMPWWMERLHGGETIHIPDVAQMPPEAAAEQEILELQEIQSLIVVPMGARNGALIGFMGFDDTGQGYAWSQEDARMLRTAAELITSHLHRQNADQALRMKEERLRLALAAGRMGTWEYEVATERLFLAPETAALYGLKPVDDQGGLRQVLERIHPQDREELFARFERRLDAGGQHADVHRALLPNGETRWVETFSNLVLDAENAPTRIIGLSIDVTGRVQLEERNRQSEAYFKALVENGLDLLCVFEADGSARYVSPGYARLLHYAIEELQGRGLQEVVHAEDVAAVRAVYREVESTPGAHGEVELRLLRKDGSLVVVQAVLTNMMAVPAVRGIVVNARDVTEARGLEAQLRHSQKMEAVGTLAGGIAHDFNNVLTAIQAHAQFVLEDPGGSAASKEDILEILGGADRAKGLTSQLLAFSRQQVSRPVIVAAASVIRGPERMLHRLIGEDVQLVVDLEEGLGSIRVDPNQLEQVLMNLAVNARDAMPDGGCLTIQARNVDVLDPVGAGSPDPMHPGRYVRIRVVDTGEGMDARTRERIFEPFFTTKALGRGTGLGLSTVFGIVKQSGGHISVESAPGVGTCFEIHLRRTTEVPEPSPGGAPGGSRHTGSETILLVEDQQAVRVVVRRGLERAGYTVHEATSGVEALAVWDRNGAEIHMMLTDVVMPQMGGAELAERLQALRPGLPVLFMSGYPEGDLTQRSVLPPGVHLIEKPFPLAELQQKVREVLGGGAAGA